MDSAEFCTLISETIDILDEIGLVLERDVTGTSEKND